MPIIKIRRENRYAQIANETLRDKRLSLDTRGFLAEMLTYSEDFDVTVEWLMQHFDIGRDRLFRITTELKENGYLEIPTLTDKAGQFLGKEWVFYGEPNLPTDIGKPVIRETRTTENKDDNTKETKIKNKSKTKEKEKNASFQEKEAIPIFPEKNTSASPHGVWVDYLALLQIQGNEKKAAEKMIGSLIKKYGAERVSRLYETHRDLLYDKPDSYAYFIGILKRDKTLSRDEAEIQTALQEAREFHNGVYGQCEVAPAFTAERYVKRWPVLTKYVEQIASGERQLPEADRKEIEREQRYHEQVMKEARFYGRID